MPTPDYTAIEKSINDAGFNISRSSREVRDKLEQLSRGIDDGTTRLSSDVNALTAAIRDSSRSSTMLSRVMIALTLLLAVSAILQTAALWRAQNRGEPQPSGGAYVSPAAGSPPAHP